MFAANSQIDKATAAAPPYYANAVTLAISPSRCSSLRL
jgi:hypothetical protein